jgi:hypothetical protein
MRGAENDANVLLPRHRGDFLDRNDQSGAMAQMGEQDQL